ncbi:Hypothetical predicted protein [Drosophila guanche]|uniref:CHK kinase-like domain-containing protein n=1 Tax=Drosophila guanche TaxID=7266 RepID=A0A3B0K2E6_DROGU|nr:Hypothetical predicted protein [Drosophila guanche]
MGFVGFVTQVSNDPSPLPAWLDQQELQSLLKQEMDDFRSIQTIRGKWEMNLVQPTFSVQLHVECAGNMKRGLSYLVKSSEPTPSGRKFPIEGDFSMELRMYEDILPALEYLYKDAGQKRDYSMANTLNGLERPAMEAVLSKLAAYHAATARYIQTSSDKKRVLPKLVEANFTLLKYRGKQLSFTVFYLDLLKYGHWGSDDADIVELFGNPLFSLQIRELLPWLENRGYFEEE